MTTQGYPKFHAEGDILVRAVLMVKPQRKYAHGRWSPTPVAQERTQVLFNLVA